MSPSLSVFVFERIEIELNRPVLWHTRTYIMTCRTHRGLLRPARHPFTGWSFWGFFFIYSPPYRSIFIENFQTTDRLGKFYFINRQTQRSPSKLYEKITYLHKRAKFLSTRDVLIMEISIVEILFSHLLGEKRVKRQNCSWQICSVFSVFSVLMS